MASIALVRRRKLLSDYINSYATSTRWFQSFSSLNNVESSTLSRNKQFCSRFSTNTTTDSSSVPLHKRIVSIGLSDKYSNGISVTGLRNVKSEFILPDLGNRWMLQSIRNASTTSSTKEKQSEDEEKMVSNKIETSPEDCDQAVEGLSTAKAKTKVKKQLEESQKRKSILQKTRAILLGIGPALRAVAAMSREDWAKKLVHWKDGFKETMKHYWLGLKLLGADIRICSRLLVKLAGGKSLSRRERQQLTRTTAYIFRLVPVAVFIVVPFMEFLLPVALKLFPNMLPSTFQDKMKEEEKLIRILTAKMEYAKFLHDTVKEMTKEVQNSWRGEIKQTAEDLDELLSKRQAVEDAGRNAGIKVLEIFSEPIAASLNNKGCLIAVFHLGRATFDVSILEITNGAFQLRTTISDTHLGEEDFDNALVEYLVSEFQRVEAVDLSKDRLALQRLREAAESAKIELSNTVYTEIYLPYIYFDALGRPKHLFVTMSRFKFEQLVHNIIDRTRHLCMKCLEDGDMTTKGIDEVILVGKMTRVPKVLEMIAEIFGKAPSKFVNPDEAVAKGAAIQGGILREELIKGIVLMGATPLSLGVESLGGIFIRVINKNTPIPTKKSQIFSTSDDDQPVIGVRVFLGEREFVYDNKLLSEFEFDVSPAPRGLLQIVVSFEINAIGVLTVYVKDQATGNEKSVIIPSLGSLSMFEIMKIIQDADFHYKRDQKRLKIENLRNIAGVTVYKLETALGYRIERKRKMKVLGCTLEKEEKRLSELRENISAEVLAEMKKSVDELKKSLLFEDMDKIKIKLEAANKALSMSGLG